MKKDTFSLFTRTVSLLQKRAWTFWFTAIGDATIMTFCHNIAFAIIMKDLFNGAVEQKSSLLIRAVILGVSVEVFACITQPLLRYRLSKSVKETMVEVRKKIYDQLENLPVSYHEKHHSGDLLARFYKDVGIMEGLFTGQIYILAGALILGVSSIALVFSLNATLALLTIAIGLVATWVNTRFAKPIRVLNHQIQERWGRVTERLIDIISGQAVMKIFHLESIIARQYFDAQEKVTKPIVKSAIVGAQAGLVNYLLDSVKSIGLIAVGAFMVIRGQTDVGTFAAVFWIQNSLYYMFNNIGSFITGTQNSLAGAKRLFEFLDMPGEPENYPLPANAETDSMIELQEVSFSYTAGKKVLNGLSIKVEEGKMAALVGFSGGGKSTVIKLLLGFYPPESGAIFIAGKSMGEYTLSKVRDSIAYVPQDIYLFDGTIEENIRYGKLEATMNELIAAARTANAHDFIMEQPEGYNTIIGENGSKLSVGQKQRIAIARAILKDAPILLLDEATSSLDSKSEQLVQEAFHRLIMKRTVLVIAHRLSTIQNADIVYVIDNGKVVEQGTHAELILKEGVYNHLYDLQFQKNEGLVS